MLDEFRIQCDPRGLSVVEHQEINTSDYHPQTDGLVEKFNFTLIQMIAKSWGMSNQDWDTHLPYLLFAYRVSAQTSTRESPFFLMYGQDARLLTETSLSHAGVSEVTLYWSGGELRPLYKCIQRMRSGAHILSASERPMVCALASIVLSDASASAAHISLTYIECATVIIGPAIAGPTGPVPTPLSC